LKTEDKMQVFAREIETSSLTRASFSKPKKSTLVNYVVELLLHLIRQLPVHDSHYYTQGARVYYGIVYTGHNDG
jgi:hypothetical protein